MRVIALPFLTRVDEIANREIVSVDEKDSVLAAVRLMVSKNVGSILVTSGKQPVGIITERDLMKRIVLENRDPTRITASEIMSTPLVTVKLGTSLGDAATLMQVKKIRRLLVQDEGRVVGIFTQRDVERAVLDYFGEISKIQ
jgi:CBS domain-containing protein